MATYKVIQDIEADDKLIWMFSFRQFVYAFIAVIFLFFSYIFYAKHVAFLDILSLPVVLFTGVLAFPFGKDQPTEVWVLAKVRFFIKPRKRIWTQDGARDLVTITVPKKVEVNLTDNLSQSEVKSKLQALANTIDTRGWAIKNVSSNINTPATANNDNDRLISPVMVSTDPSEQYVSSSEDIMDETANPLAQQMQTMINASESEHKKEIINKLQSIQEQQTLSSSSTQDQPKASGQIDENVLSNQLKNISKAQHLSLEHLRDVNKLQAEAKRKDEIIANAKTQAKAEQIKEKEKLKSISNPDIIKLANRDDLNVTVLANEINRKDSKDKEVVISLH